MNSAADLEKFLHQKIPLTVSMGVQVMECNDQRLILNAPLEPNHNHLGTAFGGSLHALATLSGYGLLWWLLREPEAHLVIRESTIRYERPVNDVLRAVCSAPPAQEMERFRKDFSRKGKARIALEAVIVQGSETAAHFHATFVALGKTA